MKDMTQEDKDLLLKDLSARLPYLTLCYCKWTKDASNGTSGCIQEVSTYLLDELMIIGNQNYECQICEIKPYLRPMSSMTEDERKELKKLCEEDLSEFAGFIRNGHGLSHDGLYMFDKLRQLEFCLSHHLDYRGLIEKGLALQAPEGMYDIK